MHVAVDAYVLDVTVTVTGFVNAAVIVKLLSRVGREGRTTSFASCPEIPRKWCGDTAVMSTAW